MIITLTYNYACVFLTLLFYAQLNETERLRALSDQFFSQNLRKETDLGSISFFAMRISI